MVVSVGQLYQRAERREFLRFQVILRLAFAAAVICRRLQDELKDTQYTPENALLSLRNHKCKVFDDHVLTMESAKRANDIYKRFKIKAEHSYDLTSIAEGFCITDSNT